VPLDERVKYQWREAMTGWFFEEIRRGFPERDPRETEFFRITGPGEAVVREFIQNSLDAKTDQEMLRVKISLHSIRRKDTHAFLDDTLKGHLKACGLIDSWGYPENIPCLVLEDYGTTGLDGSHDPGAGEGNFYNFWWREGISEKSGQRAGRWGLGKTTFHIVSKIRTLFGLTVRNDGKTLLMGKALLRTHSLNGRRYHYFGYFCADNYRPVERDSILSEFRRVFGITRNETETGFSAVIPLPVDEINFESIIEGVIQHYYYPLLAGMLNVEIRDNINNRQEELNGENLIEKASRMDWNDTVWGGIDIKQILEFIRDSLSIEPVRLEIHEPADPEITPESFGEQMDTVRERFLRGDPLRFKVPVTIGKTGGMERESFLEVLLRRFPGIRKAFEAYIRSGILVSEIKMLGSRPVAGLLIAEDPAVSEFLGDCETPAHTNWNERTEHFAGQYVNAVRTLRFIKKSMLQIVSILDEPPRERQVDFLKDIFSIPVGQMEREEEEELTRPPVIPEGIDRQPEKFNIQKIHGGFRVTLNPERRTDLSFPFQAVVKTAYDTRRGNPFSQYHKFDFDVAGTSVTVEARDCIVMERKYNILKVEITGENFELGVTGFDPRRDLVVDIK
jgi:hypothetical protein